MTIAHEMGLPESETLGHAIEPVRFVVVMGVAGCGKSTIGRALAEALQTSFLDGDDYHPRANVEKMARGEPLNDHDRWPWLSLVMGAMRGHVARNEQTVRKLSSGAETGGLAGCSVAACSALRRPYRDFMSEHAGEPIFFAHLHGAKEVIHRRMLEREDHFMPSQLLDSQFATLEHLGSDEHGLALDIALPVDKIVEQFVRAIRAVDFARARVTA